MQYLLISTATKVTRLRLSITLFVHRLFIMFIRNKTWSLSCFGGFQATSLYPGSLKRFLVFYLHSHVSPRQTFLSRFPNETSALICLLCYVSCTNCASYSPRISVSWVRVNEFRDSLCNHCSPSIEISNYYYKKYEHFDIANSKV